MKYLELQKYVEQQVKNFLCYEVDISIYIKEAITRTRNCLLRSANKYCINQEADVPFSVYHSVQYCIFLYHLSRVAYEIDKNGMNAEKFYCLNKMLNSVDVFYEVEFPSIWGTEHPLGSVMGRARYSDFFFFYQGCTVGGNKGCYPMIGEHVIMYSNSKILGNSTIGNNVIISANTYIKGEDIPDDCIVFGRTPDILIRQKSKAKIREMTEHIWPLDIV